jgi:hypothetical protein
MHRFHAFFLGLREFRLSVTTHFDDDLLEWYDRGRDLAHRATLRRYE